MSLYALLTRGGGFLNRPSFFSFRVAEFKREGKLLWIQKKGIARMGHPLTEKEIERMRKFL